jgi:hypothetical protein
VNRTLNWGTISTARSANCRMGEEPLATAFDDVDFHLDRMDRQGVEVSVLSILRSAGSRPARAREGKMAVRKSAMRTTTLAM